MMEEKLRKKVDEQVKRMKGGRAPLFSQSAYLGTLALLFVFPIVVGAYLGRWLDERSPGYSYRYSVGLIVAGVFIGMLNVYLFMRERR